MNNDRSVWTRRLTLTVETVDLFVVKFWFLFCMSCEYKKMSEIKLRQSSFYVVNSCSLYKSSPLVRLSIETDLDLLNYFFRTEEVILSHAL